MAKQPPPSGPKGRIGPSAAGSGSPSRPRIEQKQSDARQTSLEAGRALQRLLDSAPAAQVSKTVDAATSKNAERALDMASTLEVHVPVGRVTEIDIDRKIDQIRHTISIVEPRGHGEALRAGDEANIDLLGFMGGDIFLAHTDTWYALAPNKFLPGLFEALVGARVPD